jgi:hypothetical protein
MMIDNIPMQKDVESTSPCECSKHICSRHNQLEVQASVKSFGTVLAITGLLFSFSTQSYAAPAPVLTFSNPPTITSSANAGPLTDNSTYKFGQQSTWWEDKLVSISTEDRYKVIIAPTNTATGVAEHWVDSTQRYDVTNYTAYTDYANYTVAGNAGNYAPGQWIEIAGTVTANEATTFNFYLQASGNYLTTAIPGVGNVNPALPSLLAGFGSNPLTSVAAISSYSQSGTSQYSVDSYTYWYQDSIVLAAGEQTSFAALVYAGGDVSLANFRMNISSGNYGLVTQTTTGTAYPTSQFVETVITPPVPEPETYALLLCGLGFISFISYRRKSDPSAMLMAA